MIPKQIVDEPLVRVCRPECRVHSGCSSRGKRPVKSPDDPEPLEVVERWVNRGGNAAVVTGRTGLVVVDIDSYDLLATVHNELPESFTVKTGSGWYHRYYHVSGWSRNVEFKENGNSLGSIRGDGWIAVVPPSEHAETGKRYAVSNDMEIREVDVNAVEAVVEAFESGDERKESERASERERAQGGDLDELDELIRHDRYRGEVRDVLSDRQAGHDRRVWLAGFLLNSVGLSISETVGVISRHNQWENFDRETTKEQVRSVSRSSGGGL